MRLQKGQNPNCPPRGSRIKVEPIRTKKAIEVIRSSLRQNPRDLCLFTLGIDTAFRAGELLSIRVGQVRHLQVGDGLDLKQSKTSTYRLVTLNRTAVEAIRYYFRHDQNLLAAEDDSYLFYSRFGDVLTVPSLTRKVKGWCADIGLKGNYGSINGASLSLCSWPPLVMPRRSRPWTTSASRPKRWLSCMIWSCEPGRHLCGYGGRSARAG